MDVHGKVEGRGGGKEKVVVDDGPSLDDVCPICFHDYTMPCKANCGHWFCGTAAFSFLFSFFFVEFINLPSVSWYLVKIHSTGFVYVLMPLVAEKMCCLTTRDLIREC